MNGVGIYPLAIIDPLADCASLYARNRPFDERPLLEADQGLGNLRKLPVRRTDQGLLQNAIARLMTAWKNPSA